MDNGITSETLRCERQIKEWVLGEDKEMQENGSTQSQRTGILRVDLPNRHY